MQEVKYILDKLYHLVPIFLLRRYGLPSAKEKRLIELSNYIVCISKLCPLIMSFIVFLL